MDINMRGEIKERHFLPSLTEREREINLTCSDLTQQGERKDLTEQDRSSYLGYKIQG